MKIFTVMGLCAALVVVSQSCSANKREDDLVRRYSEATQVSYAHLLVDVARYTTNGAFYHEKYRRLLIGLAGELVEGRELSIVPGSIGFYFDKNSREQSNLYLGLDIDAGASARESYNEAASYFMRRGLREIIQVVRACSSVFAEKEVVGMVIGWRWTSRGLQEQINIWMNEDDVLRFEEKRLTYEELVQRSVITNTEGKIIRVPVL
jgi:hypothetical protein